MRTASTIGFAIEEKDRGRLDHLAETFAGGNRSAFLRQAMSVMERLELARELGRLQAYGAERLAGSGHTIDDIPMIVEEALRDPGRDAIAEAKLIVADLTRRIPAPAPLATGGDERLRAALAEALQSTRPA